MTTALSIRNAFKSYPQKGENVKVLDNFNLTAKRGSIYCLIGPSGAGKTTLFSSILGITQLDSGEISIFGHGTEKSRKLAQLPQVVGFMPQETSLVEELTVSENLSFFANLYEMSSDDFEKRYEVLRNVLEIPADNRRVANCSGGQKRRISLAIAILCEPKLLFLDEPTVGVDPILRENIWKFLRSSVENNNMTVIVTTHYINEAEQSDCVGMLRQGRLLIEDSPKVIYEKFNLNSLDDVFALLCTKNVEGKFIEVVNNFDEKEENVLGSLEKINQKFEGERKNFSTQRLKSLIKKEFLVLLRQPALFLFILLLPVSSFYFCGQIFFYPSFTPIGIINNEVNCTNLPRNSSQSCVYENLSCRQIDEIKKTQKFKIINYKNFDDALSDGKAGKLYGILNFKRNFSQTLSRRLKPVTEVELDEDLYVIDFYPDHSDLHMAQFVIKSIEKSIKEFLSNLIEKDCNLSPKLAVIAPVNFEQPIYSYPDNSYLGDLVYSFYFGMLFMLSISFCCLSVINDRKNGSWNRELLSGVSLFEVIVAHFIVNIVVMIFQLSSLFFVFKYTMDLPNNGNVMVESLLTILIYISGVSFGLLFSCEVESYFLAVYTSIGLTIGQVILSGSIWPLSGMHFLIKPLAYIFPATLPAQALKNMFLKGFLCHWSILIGFLIPLGWILFSFLGLLFVLRRKKFSSL